ncbi:MAG: CBS domain-containing protein [Desulfonatronovibrio sp.]
MTIVTSHSNTDFDALASMVAASFLYPGAQRVLPSQVSPQVRDFLAVHWDLLQIRSRKQMDLSDVSRLIVTDTSNWERLDNIKKDIFRSDPDIIIWDHHMSQGNIDAGSIYKEEVGATVTLLLEQMKARDTAFSPVHATLFLLGIYDDTGSLSFPSTTARDAYMAGFLLENGADLNVVSAYLDNSLDSRHLDVFSRMLASSETFSSGSLRFGVCVQNAEKSLNMLPAVVNKFKDIKGLDAAFGIFPMSASKTIVIGRNNAGELDLGAIMRKLGGGGHPGAGSAVIKAGVEEAHEQVVKLIQDADIREQTVGSAMSPVKKHLSPENTLRQAKKMMDESSSRALLVVDENRVLSGVLEEKQFSKIRSEQQWDQPVTSMTRRQIVTVNPHQPLREALQLMSSSETGFLRVVEKGILMGQITRSTIILNMYDF